jgi:hypothetical protein
LPSPSINKSRLTFEELFQKNRVTYGTCSITALVIAWEADDGGMDIAGLPPQSTLFPSLLIRVDLLSVLAHDLMSVLDEKQCNSLSLTFASPF